MQQETLEEIHHNDQIPEFGTEASAWDDDAAFAADDFDDLPQAEGEAFASTANVFGAHELSPGQLFNVKVPPAFDGRSSFFAYETLVYEWRDITVIDKEKQGAMLRTRLILDAATFKETLDPAQLNTPDGLEYFLKEEKEVVKE